VKAANSSFVCPSNKETRNELPEESEDKTMDNDAGATILTIEDDDFLRANITAYLEDVGFRVLEAGDGATGLSVCRGQRPDLVLLDLRLPEMDGLQFLEAVRQGPEAQIPVIVVSGMGVFSDVVASLRLGAWDYITKPIQDMGVLDHAVRSALEKARLRRENEEYQKRLEQQVASRTEELQAANRELQKLRHQLELENEYLRDEIYSPATTGPFVGRSSALKTILHQIENVASTDVTVLIVGETGTGKELVARAIHEQSQRSERPLIKVNCASIPRELFESEFFGHVKGAFTGAVQDRVGRFQLAHRGTLFLDEVGEIPLELQGKLLRVLQEGEFERVGEDATRHVDVRLVAATNRNLEEEVQTGRFREDLYYRLNVYPILVPPLRQRIEDILPLADHFLGQVSRKLGISKPTLRRGQILRLESYEWPGNVRELENVIERAAILSRGGTLHIEPLSSDRRVSSSASQPQVAEQEVEPEEIEVLSEVEVRLRERENILAALRKAGWKVSGPGGAADLLGIKPTTLAARMKSMGISKQR
jgi:DNA-binding NtrC family response regulator